MGSERIQRVTRPGVALFLTLLLASSASAANLFVSPRGNDSAAGSSDAPLRTITAAAQKAKPGDIVNVRAGTYFDPVKIETKGMAEARIVFRPARGETVVLDGTRIPADTAVVQLTGTRFVDFTGFEVRNSRYIGISMWDVRQTRITNNHVHHARRNGIYAGAEELGGNSDITVSGNRVHDTVLENARHNMKSGGWAGAVVISDTIRATIERNRIWNNHGEGLIYLTSSVATIRKNEIFDNFSAYLYLDNARYVRAEENLLYSTGDKRFFREGKPPAGIGVANETKPDPNLSRDNVFNNNTVIGTRWGFYYGNYERGGGLRNTRVTNNRFAKTLEEPIRIESGTNLNNVIEGNKFE